MLLYCCVNNSTVPIEMDSIIFRRNTRKSYGGENQTNFEKAKMKLKKLRTNLKWINTRKSTKLEREQLPQKVINQQRIVNELQKKATGTQNNSILSGITNTLQSTVNTVTHAAANNKLTITSKSNSTNRRILQPATVRRPNTSLRRNASIRSVTFPPQQSFMKIKVISPGSETELHNNPNINELVVNAKTLLAKLEKLSEKKSTTQGGRYHRALSKRHTRRK